MAIEVEWQDEDGRCLLRYEGPPIESQFVRFATADSICLRFIDPYGDTTFNAAQVSVLLLEIEILSSQSPKFAETAKSLVDFISRCTERTHRYLKFIGD